MRTSVSIPEDVFQSAEEAARRLGLKRSQLYAEAVRRFLRSHPQEDKVMERLAEVYSREPSNLDPVVMQTQTRTLEDEGW